MLVIAAVGYFLLGPEELYRLSKEIGKVVGQAREYVTKSGAEWQATLDGEAAFEFKRGQGDPGHTQPRKNCRTLLILGVRGIPTTTRTSIPVKSKIIRHRRSRRTRSWTSTTGTPK